MKNGGKLSYSDDKTDPNVIIAKAQASADHWRQQAQLARAIAFDLLYPKYKTDDLEFKQLFIYYKEELKHLISQRDALKDTVKKQREQISRLRAALMTTLPPTTETETEDVCTK